MVLAPITLFQLSDAGNGLSILGRHVSSKSLLADMGYKINIFEPSLVIESILVICIWKKSTQRRSSVFSGNWLIRPYNKILFKRSLVLLRGVDNSEVSMFELGSLCLACRVGSWSSSIYVISKKRREDEITQ